MRKIPPAADPSLEGRLSPAMRRALDAYVALERRVQPVASGSCSDVCGVCRTPCCEAAYCSEAWKAPWLRVLTSRPGARRDVRTTERAIEGHLASEGCRLRFGRPPVCYEYACHDVVRGLATDDEKYLFRVLSHIVTFAGEDALPGTHLAEVADLGQLRPPAVRRLMRRICLAERIFEAAARLFRAHGRGVAKDWSLVTRHFSSQGYRITFGREAAPEAASRSMLRSLPIVRAGALLFAVTLALVLGGAGCATPVKRLDLSATPAGASPAAAVATAPTPAATTTTAAPKVNEYRDADAEFAFDARTDTIRLKVKNLSQETLTISWDRAFFVDAAGKKVPVIGYAEPRTAVLRQDPPAPLIVPAGGTWSGKIHRRDRIRPPSGPRFYESDILEEEERKAGATVGLDLPVDIGRRPLYHEFRFKVTEKEVAE